MKRTAAALGFLLAATLAAAAALNFPALSGRVVDEAGILDAATREALTQKLAALEAKSTDQFVVVTLKSLQGTSIEDFGVQLGRHWGIGQKSKNNGILLIVAPNERKVRIEVGYGLEGTLTDAIARFIIENSILPRFKAGDMAGGIRRGSEDIIQVLTGDAEDYKQRASTPVSPSGFTPIELIVIGFFGIIIAYIVFTTIIGGLDIVHDILVALGLAKKRKSGFWYEIDHMSRRYGGSSSSGGSSSGGFSGGGGSFGGGGSSGSW